MINLPNNTHTPNHHPLQPPKNSISGSIDGSNGGGYVDYHGLASNFPKQRKWASFAALWKQNSALMKLHDSDNEIAFIKFSLETVARSSGVDIRAILCIIVRESGGGVRVGSMNNGVLNPSITQSHAGVSFNPQDPAGIVLQTMKDGTEGTKSGYGLQQCYERFGD